MIPIYAENNYISEQKAVVNGGQRRYHSKVWQFLCVRRENKEEFSAAYITLLPIKSYYTRNRNQVLDKFLDAETYYGDFTGYIMYNNIVDFRLLTADKIKGGKLHWGFSRSTAPTRETFMENYKKMFQDISILRVVSTKSDLHVDLEEVVVTWCSKCNMSADSSHSCPSDNSNNNNDYNGGDFWIGGGGGSNSGGSEWGSSSGGGSGSSGGGGQSTYWKNYSSASSDKFGNFSVNIPTIFPQQSALSTCFTTCLSYIDKLYGGKNTEAYYNNAFEETTGIDILALDGLNGTQITEMVLKYLDIVLPFTSYTDAINKGYCVLTNVGGHAVLIVGYKENGDLIYMDPNQGLKYGVLRVAGQNNFGSDMRIMVKGTKK